MTPLGRRLAAQAPLTVEAYMAACNAHYYATRDPLGVGGDFTTAPEISQMFGELIGAWVADLWQRAGQPEIALVELGPGRGTLMADLLRVAGTTGLRPPVHLVETSSALRAAQAARVSDAAWHDDVETLPADRPLLIVANEFFDALPIRQFIGDAERMVTIEDDRFTAAIGAIREDSPVSRGVVAALAARLRDQGGAMLVVDYGYSGPATGDTLQAVRQHRYADPFTDPGEADLTAHVDFTALARAADGVTVHGSVPQGQFLRALGLDQRAARLNQQVEAHRLASAAQMGRLFKAMALTSRGWPTPAGFA